jgi:hypothetical protein
MRLSGSIGMAGPEWLKHDELLAGAAAARYVERERACFKETNIFPIMHVAAMKGEIVDRYPWVTAMPAVGALIQRGRHQFK